MLKPEEDITIKENYRPINIMHKNANIPKNTRKSNFKTYFKITYHDQVGFIPRMQG